MDWERSETNTGVPYYVNHSSERTQWDHPRLVRAMEELGLLDNIVFAAYRIAMKLRKLQKTLHHFVDLTAITTAFEQHVTMTTTHENFVDAFQLRAILHEVLYITKTRRRSKLSIDTCSDLLLNWILNLYDIDRTGFVSLFEAQVSLVALCSSRPVDKYRYLFHVSSAGRGFLTRKRLEILIQTLLKITDNLRETKYFCSSISSAVNSCMANEMGNSISVEGFLNWMLAEPQTLVWLPTLHRLAAAETMKHEAKCNICKAHPVIGFRYKCLKCLNFDLCQDCFFTGRTHKNHKYTHPTQEFCLPASSKDDIRALAKTVRNKISKKHGKRIKQKYLSIDDDDTSKDEPYRDRQENQERNIHARLGHLSQKLNAVERDPSPFVSNQRVTPEVARDDHSDSKLQKNDELEVLVDALENENEFLAAELEDYYKQAEEDTHNQPKHRRWSTSSSSSVSSQEKVRVQSQIVEEHNRNLHSQLAHLKQLLKLKQKPGMNQSVQFTNPNQAMRNVGDMQYLDRTAPPRYTFNPPSKLHGDTVDGGMHSLSNLHINPKDQSYNSIGPFQRANSQIQQSSYDPYPVAPPLSVSHQQINVAPPTYQSALSGGSPLIQPLTSHHVTFKEDINHMSNVSRGQSFDGLDYNRRFLPPHLIDQSTVNFPNMSVSRVFPSEEAELEELVQRVNRVMGREIFDDSDFEPANPVVRAANRMSDAMSNLVAQVAGPDT